MPKALGKSSCIVYYKSQSEMQQQHDSHVQLSQQTITRPAITNIRLYLQEPSMYLCIRPDALFSKYASPSVKAVLSVHQNVYIGGSVEKDKTKLYKSVWNQSTLSFDKYFYCTNLDINLPQSKFWNPYPYQVSPYCFEQEMIEISLRKYLQHILQTPWLIILLPLLKNKRLLCFCKISSEHQKPWLPWENTTFHFKCTACINSYLVK